MAANILLTGKGKKPQIKDLTGEKFGKLTALEHVASKLKNGGAIWRCLCDCGNTKDVESKSLASKTGTKSCGCLRSEASKRNPVDWTVNVSHGMAGHGSRAAEYIAWSSMIQRCTNKKHKHYHNYGGRGIAVCEEWRKSFSAFFLDMGVKPTPSHSLDRVDVDGPYSSNNCRWSDMTTQQNNRRNNKVFVFHGQKLTCAMICRIAGTPERTTYNRLKNVPIGTDVTSIIEAKIQAASLGRCGTDQHLPRLAE